MTAKGLNVTRNNQRGFSLWEVIIAISVLSVLGAVFLPNLSSTIDYGSRQKTEARLELLREATIDAYEKYAMTIDDYPQAQLRFRTWANNEGLSQALLRSTTAQSDGQRGSHLTGFEVLSTYAGSNPFRLSQDGFGLPWEVYVTDRLSRQWRGYTVYYHVVAYVSSGGDDELHRTTSFDEDTGELRLGGNDVGITVSGYPIQVEKYKETLGRLRRIARTYEAYYRSRYLASAQRDATMSYFSRPCVTDSSTRDRYQASNPMADTCNHNFDYPAGTGDEEFSPMVTRSCDDMTKLGTAGNGHSEALGLNTRELKTAWGYPISYGVGPDSNCDADDTYSRNPSSSNSNARTPPFTALIQGWAPGGVPLVVAATGTY